ncbi:TrkH family potassium uptake protein [Angustibacter sp. McL0619]|uniref:TrkH family potassium uptake protein n=1 Tax=Angustibacter sp. McL0619 TaxID=3415676 RepID=UPI003CEB04DA
MATRSTTSPDLTRVGGPVGWVRARIDIAARQSPARLALSVFALVIGVFTALLSLPAATSSGQRAPFADALFTAASAVCVTGLTTVDTATYWSGLGQVLIMVAIKIGGLGIITLASLLGLAVARRLGLRQRLIAASETKALRLADVRGLLRAVVIMSTSLELAIAVVLLPSFLAEGDGLGTALYHSLFYGISSFNNAGFSVTQGGAEAWSGNPFVLGPLAIGVFMGSLGFPVVLTVANNLRRKDGVRRGRRGWNLHTRLTLVTTLVVLVVAIVGFAAFEWTNPGTLGSMSFGDRVLNSVFAGVMPRSGGFSAVPVNEMHETTWAFQDLLMFIGGGSASTAGGIKVTTLAVLVLATVAEARGDRDVEAFGRRIPHGSLRLAVTVLLAGATLVLVSALALLAISGRSLDVVLFETVSAFGTCGLSTGLSAELPSSGKYVLTALMFAGRTGTMTLAAALALRDRRRVVRLPEERPVVG